MAVNYRQADGSGLPFSLTIIIDSSGFVLAMAADVVTVFSSWFYAAELLLSAVAFRLIDPHYFLNSLPSLAPH